ncbi:MAG: SCO family protein [Phycisphaeraceae bacterium]|nr:SCO family protein [Phycisphaeraceae bacterium]
MKMSFSGNRALIILILGCLVAGASVEPLKADEPADDPMDRPVGRIPREVEELQIIDRLNELVPFEAELRDETGHIVRLGDFFESGKPVILNLGYYSCPSLCSRVLNGLLDSLKDLEWMPGENFTVVTLSIDHRETPQLAAAKKEAYMAELGRPGAENGWHFLTGSERNVRMVADAVGFNFRWDDMRRMYAHPAVIIIVTPDGRVARYLSGIVYPSQVVRRSLVEAADGRIGTFVDQIFLACFSFDPARGRYTVEAMFLMQAAGSLSVLVIMTLIGRSLYRERVRRRAAGTLNPGAASES